MKRYIAILFAAFVCLQAYAQGTAMDFIRADRSPLTMGTAGAGYASLSSGTAFAAFGNPALVPLAEATLDAAGAFGMLPGGDSRTTVYGGGVSVKFGSFGVSAAYLGGSYPEIAFSSEGGGASGHFKPADMMAGVGLSFAVGDFLSFGVLGRYASSALDSKTSLTSFSGDVSAVFRKDDLSVSAAVIALGPKVTSIGNKAYSLPSSARLAAAYKFGFGDFSLDLLADADYYFSANVSAAAGVQAAFKEMAFLRAGYRFSSVKADFAAAPVQSGFSAGAGVHLFGVRLDFAASFEAPLGTALMLSLGYSF